MWSGFLPFSVLLLGIRCSGNGMECTPTTLTFPLVYKVMHEVSAKWAEVGRFLDIPQNRLDVIRQDCPNVDCCYSRMLQTWYDMHTSVSWHEIVDALKGVHQTRLATRIQWEYLCYEDYSVPDQDLNYVSTKLYGVFNNEELMEKLEGSFQDLVCAAVTTISKTVNLVQFRQRLINLPVSLKIKHKSFFTKEMISYITKAESIDEVFGYLSLYWNFLNCDLLDYIVRKFGDESLDTLMGEYMIMLEGFRERTSLKEFLSMWPKDMDPPPGFTQYTLKLPRNPLEMTLQDIEHFRRQHADNYSLQSYALMLGSLEEGSTVLTFFVRTNIIRFMMQENSLNGIPGMNDLEYVALDHCILFDSVHKECRCTQWSKLMLPQYELKPLPVVDIKRKSTSHRNTLWKDMSIILIMLTMSIMSIMLDAATRTMWALTIQIILSFLWLILTMVSLVTIIIIGLFTLILLIIILVIVLEVNVFLSTRETRIILITLWLSLASNIWITSTMSMLNWSLDMPTMAKIPVQIILLLICLWIYTIESYKIIHTQKQEYQSPMKADPQEKPAIQKTIPQIFKI